jgi:hypothetical protein
MKMKAILAHAVTACLTLGVSLALASLFGLTASSGDGSGHGLATELHSQEPDTRLLARKAHAPNDVGATADRVDSGGQELLAALAIAEQSDRPRLQTDTPATSAHESPTSIPAVETPITVEQELVELDGFFDTETWDASWAPRTEKKMLRMFDDAGLEGSMLIDARCRSTLCRVEVDHANEAAEMNFLAAFATRGSFLVQDTFRYRHGSENGESQSVFYVSRRGHSLPTRTD